MNWEMDLSTLRNESPLSAEGYEIKSLKFPWDDAFVADVSENLQWLVHWLAYSKTLPPF